MYFMFIYHIIMYYCSILMAIDFIVYFVWDLSDGYDSEDV